jgi:alkylation response protein AidB-like acyl-CoA dehydrogenase
MAHESDERRLLRESVADFVARAVAPKGIRAVREQDDGFDRRRLREIAGFGWIRLALAEEHGGLGLGCGELAVLHEELGRGATPEPVAVLGLAAQALAAAESTQRRLEPVLEGQSLATLAWQGGAGALGAAGVGCVAVRDGDGWRLDGRAVFVPLAGIADLYLVAARAADDVALFALERGATGLAIESQRAADYSVVGTLTLNAVPVARDACLRERAGVLFDRLLDRARVAAAAELAGAMDRALQMTLAYMRTRVQFGKPIGAFQAQQHKAVDLYVQLELARASVAAAAQAIDENAEDAALANTTALAVARCKARASDAGILIGGRAVHLHGAIGITEEYDLGLYIRRMHFLAAWLGNGNAMRRRFADLNRGAFGSTAAVEPNPGFGL